MAEKDHKRFFQQVFHFWIVVLLDLLLVTEVGLHTLMMVDLETGFIQAILILCPSNVVNGQRQSFGDSTVTLRVVNIGRRGTASITGVFVIVEIGNDIVNFLRLWYFLHRQSTE